MTYRIDTYGYPGQHYNIALGEETITSSGIIAGQRYFGHIAIIRSVPRMESTSSGIILPSNGEVAFVAHSRQDATYQPELMDDYCASAGSIEKLGIETLRVCGEVCDVLGDCDIEVTGDKREEPTDDERVLLGHIERSIREMKNASGTTHTDSPAALHTGLYL